MIKCAQHVHACVLRSDQRLPAAAFRVSHLDLADRKIKRSLSGCFFFLDVQSFTQQLFPQTNTSASLYCVIYATTHSDVPTSRILYSFPKIKRDFPKCAAPSVAARLWLSEVQALGGQVSSSESPRAKIQREQRPSQQVKCMWTDNKSLHPFCSISCTNECEKARQRRRQLRISSVLSLKWKVCRNVTQASRVTLFSSKQLFSRRAALIEREET